MSASAPRWSCHATIVPPAPSGAIAGNFWAPPGRLTGTPHDGQPGGKKNALLVSRPHAPMTTIGPTVAPAGTVASRWVSVSSVKLAATPLKLTAVTDSSRSPVIATVLPTSPETGENPVIRGA